MDVEIGLDGTATQNAQEWWVRLLVAARSAIGAAGVAPSGLRAVGVTGPHPEAPLSWYTDAGLDVPSPLPHSAFTDLVTTTLVRRR